VNGKVTPGQRTSVPKLDSNRDKQANSPVLTYYLSDRELTEYRKMKRPTKAVSSYIPSKDTVVRGWL
jgi:hypothetical protein